MSRLILVLPDESMEKPLWDMRSEFLNAGSPMDGSASMPLSTDYASWLAKNRAYRAEETTPEGKVPAHTYAAVRTDTGEIAGMIDIRHRLNEYLLQYGGHIGYSIRPAMRQKGYGSEMLGLALQKCREMGLARVLITCDKCNIASAKTMQSQGAVMENEVMEDGVIVQRYWITL